MSEDRRRILDMLVQEKVTVDDAERLLKAIDKPVEDNNSGDESSVPEGRMKKKIKFLRIVVDGGGKEKINIRIPVQLIKAGIKLSSLVPEKAKEKINSVLEEKGLDIDLGNAKNDSVDELLGVLSEVHIDIEDGKERIRIFCE